MLCTFVGSNQGDRHRHGRFRLCDGGSNGLAGEENGNSGDDGGFKEHLNGNCR